MSPNSLVIRCHYCGAPLKNPTELVVTCRYCDADNRLDLGGDVALKEAARQAEALRHASAQADALIPEIHRRAEELQAAMGEELEKLHCTDDSEARAHHRAEAARLFEAYFRLQQRPGLLIAAAAGPMGEEMFQRVDQATGIAVQQFLDGLPK